MKNLIKNLAAQICLIVAMLITINIKAANFHAAYNCTNLLTITDVCISTDGADGFLAVISGLNYSNYNIINLVKLDNQFNVTWTRYIDYSSNSTVLNIWAFDIKHDNSNGGYAICGMFDPLTNPHGYLMKIDDNGNVLWLKDAVDGNLNNPCKELRSVEIVGDSYISCGYSRNSAFGSIDKGFIWSVDQNTQFTEWVRVITENSPYNDIKLYDVAYNPADNTIYTCGTWYAIGNPEQAVVASYDLSGTNNYVNLYNEGNVVSAKALAVNTNEIYITGCINNSTDMHMFVVDASTGLVNTTKNIYNIDLSDEVEDILYHDDYLYYTGGAYINSYGYYQGMLLQTDILGNQVFSALYSGVYSTGSPYEEIKFYKMLYRTNFTDPSIIKIGISNSNRSFYIAETYIGYSEGCNDINVSAQQQSFNPVPDPIITEESGTDQPLKATTDIYTTITDETVLCYSPNWITMPQDYIVNHNLNNIETIENKIEINNINNQIFLPAKYDGCLYKLYSVDGKLIDKNIINNNLVLDISSLKKGIYLLYLHSVINEIKTVKISKQ